MSAPGTGSRRLRVFRIRTATHRLGRGQAYVAVVTTITAAVLPVLPDIAFPLRTRSGDAAGIDRRSAGNPASERPARPQAPLPFLVDRLLCAPGPFGLDVEVKSDERVVGTWTIEVSSRNAEDAYVSRAKGNLYLCASARGDERMTGAFLVIRQWWAQVCEREQLEQLYEALSVAALERLDSLLGGMPNETGEFRSCVLFLIDGRRQDRTHFSLDRLQIRILEDLESEHTVAGIDLRVAHGHGTGTRPHTVFASTLPATMESGDSALGASTHTNPGSPKPRGALIGEVFMRETLSPENVRWQRRASDRAREPTRAAH
jgi:hypothetical protein